MDALDLAWPRVASTPLKTLATNSGATLESKGRVLRLKIIDRECLIDLDSREIKYVTPRPAIVDSHIQVLVLHYLMGAGNAQLVNRFVTFREFEGGALYYSAFKARAIDTLVTEFGEKPDILRHIGDAIKAEPLDKGDVAFKLNFFPKMPVGVLLWVGDEEVPTSANMLFDVNAGKVLPTEDISVVGGATSRRLIEISRR